MSNSLAAVHPELIVEWSDRNLPLTPDSVTFGSNKKVWWKGTCGHEWETSVKARSNGEKCPICSGARVVTGINDLSTLKPELASEWSEKNEIKPTEVSIGSHKKVLWKCNLGHEWAATVKSRTINKTGCPCSIILLVIALFQFVFPDELVSKTGEFMMKAVGFMSDGTINLFFPILSFLVIGVIFGIGSYAVIRRTELR